MRLLERLKQLRHEPGPNLTDLVPRLASVDEVLPQFLEAQDCVFARLPFFLVQVVRLRRKFKIALALRPPVARLQSAVGVLLFSGSLYVLVLSGQKWLGAVTPIGGLAFIVGWVSLAVALWPSR